jgi:5-methylcytosine-specific restriction endonuclease McrA
MRNKDQYPDNWYDEIRPRILARDKYKCQQCGIKHRQWVATKKNEGVTKIESNEQEDYRLEGFTVYMIKLHVCHKNNVKSDLSDNNLISKCVSCHAKMDGNYKALIRKGNKINNQLSIYDDPSYTPHPPSLASLGRSVSSHTTGL